MCLVPKSWLGKRPKEVKSRSSRDAEIAEAVLDKRNVSDVTETGHIAKGRKAARLVRICDDDIGGSVTQNIEDIVAEPRSLVSANWRPSLATQEGKPLNVVHVDWLFA